MKFEAVSMGACNYRAIIRPIWTLYVSNSNTYRISVGQALGYCQALVAASASIIHYIASAFLFRFVQRSGQRAEGVGQCDLVPRTCARQADDTYTTPKLPEVLRPLRPAVCSFDFAYISIARTSQIRHKQVNNLQICDIILSNLMPVVAV